MNSMVTYHQSELARNADVRPASLADYPLRQIASDVAMLVAVLAFVATFVALRLTLFAPSDIVEGTAIPVAAGASVVCVLALLGSLALRHGDARGRT